MLDYQARSAFFDPRELVDEYGRPLRLQDLPEHVATAPTSVELDDHGHVLRARWDRSGASTNLAKNQRLLTERHEHHVTGAIGVEEARRMSTADLDAALDRLAEEIQQAKADIADDLTRGQLARQRLKADGK